MGKLLPIKQRDPNGNPPSKEKTFNIKLDVKITESNQQNNSPIILSKEIMPEDTFNVLFKADILVPAILVVEIFVLF